MGRQEPSGEVKIRHYESHRLCQGVDNLSDEDQEALTLVMNVMIARPRVIPALVPMDASHE